MTKVLNGIKEGKMNMKCDELKPIFIPTRGITGDTLLGVGYYPSNAVDAAIEELKDIIKNNQSAYYVDLGIVANDCEKLKAENRKLKRALWMARALALSRFDVDEYLRKYTHCNSRFWNNGFNTFNEACKQMQKAINIAEAKCRAKAEEYK